MIQLTLILLENILKIHTIQLLIKTLKLYITKGVYHYEYMDSFNKFEENKLPNKYKFYSSLNDENISKHI